MIDEIYKKIVTEVITRGAWRETRNAKTYSSFGHSCSFYIGNKFPLLSLRKIFYKGVFGEFKSFLEGADTVAKFQANGCNFWNIFEEDGGALNIDYPPGKQLDYVINLIKTDPNSRRMVIDLWNPEHIGKLSLECCHTQYQFYVDDGELDMIWTQRSVDLALGLPSDFILAALYVITIAKECGLEPGKVTMNFGDAHIYEDHLDDMVSLINRPSDIPPSYTYDGNINDFQLDDVVIADYEPLDGVKFKLHG